MLFDAAAKGVAWGRETFRFVSFIVVPFGSCSRATVAPREGEVKRRANRRQARRRSYGIGPAYSTCSGAQRSAHRRASVPASCCRCRRS
jgi:hypothetical protein